MGSHERLRRDEVIGADGFTWQTAYAGQTEADREVLLTIRLADGTRLDFPFRAQSARDLAAALVKCADAESPPDPVV